MATSTASTPLKLTRDGLRTSKQLSPKLPHDLPTRPNLKRRSPLSSTRRSAANILTSSEGPHAQLDSSDDEGIAPSLSAAAEELLGRGTPGRHSAQESEVEATFRHSRASYEHRPSFMSSITGEARSNPLQLRPDTLSSTSPRSGSPRIVRISRNSSAMSGGQHRAHPSWTATNGSPRPTRSTQDLKTPAPRSRSPLLKPTSPNNDPLPAKNPTSGDSHGRSSTNPSYQTGPSGQIPIGHNQDNGVSHSAGSRGKSEENALQNSSRLKRVGKVQGRFLSGPARRGVIRRQSEEDNSPTRAQQSDAGYNAHIDLLHDGRYVQGESVPSHDVPETLQQSNHVHFTIPSSQPDSVVHGARTDPSMSNIPRSSVRKEPFNDSIIPAEQVQVHLDANVNSHEAHDVNSFKVPPPLLPSFNDQENEPPPTFKRNMVGSDTAPGKLGDIAKSGQGRTPMTNSPSRRPLASRSQNTPRRPAPPPPKMSMLETATATAGAASTSQRRLKRQYISINGKMFTKMECIGRGGSGRVYRVMAENFKHFALKRVSLEEVDQAAIRGFKGEIDLLKKLENVDRVVRIYDYEINDEKKSLSVLMDLGELDLKKILDPRLDDETGHFDITFTRYIWKEMLECVQAIHSHDVVHSDLKPANFVSAQGRLKLIDFGIANAIQDDTVNVHREQQIGTPNYMAPEALLDTNAPGGRKSNIGKLMKLGKPSDVWSLACILYQIVYGKPPFGHIPNQMNKVIAITDASHAIVFPDLGIGKIPVPSGLIRTLRRCLNRDPASRPTIPELLGDRDPFLHPDSAGSIQITSDHLKAIQHNVLRIIEAHGLPDAEDKPKDEAIRQWLDRWAPQLFTSMKASIERAAT